MSVVVWLARVVTAVVFTLSAVGKLSDMAATRQAVTDFGVAARWQRSVAVALPGVELATAALALIPLVSWIGGLLALALLATFTVGIVVNLGQGRRPDCNCFGSLTRAPISWRAVVRNVVLAVPALLILLATP